MGIRRGEIASDPLERGLESRPGRRADPRGFLLALREGPEVFRVRPGADNHPIRKGETDLKGPQ